MEIRREIRKYLSRKRDAQKGDFGRVFIVAGSRGLSGACYMSSMAALRSGAGLVTVGAPKSLLPLLARRFTEAMTLPLPETTAGTLSARAYQPAMKFLSKENILAIGPGLSLNRETQSCIRRLVSNSRKPMVIDADGLNAFKGKAKWFQKLKAPAILTPHGGEFVRLFGGKAPKGDRMRRERARQTARNYGITLVLKGYHTVVASKTGKLYVNKTGNPGMATGGSGDVLTGVIAAMLGQRVDPFLAACFGVFIHGLAGDIAKKEKGETSLIASDILNALPRAFRKVLGR